MQKMAVTLGNTNLSLDYSHLSRPESVGFEPTCPIKDNCISSAARYDHFDNSPCHISQFTANP